MTTAVKRTRGAQPGNRNAGKPGFSPAPAPTPEQRQILRAISRSHGYEVEIIGLRQSLKSLLSKETPDYRLIKQGYSSLKFFTRQQLLIDRNDSRMLVKTAKDILRDMSFLVNIICPSRSSKRVSP